MKRFIVLLAGSLVLVSMVPAAGEDRGPGPAGAWFTSRRYQVKVRPPKGWKRTLDKPTPAGEWVDIVRYREARTGATITLSASATRFGSGAEMIAYLKKSFSKDASLAILRTEELGATATRPRAVLFEYTFRGPGGPEHALALYCLNLGRRFRVYARVREIAWRSVAEDVKAFAASLGFTSRAWRKRAQNYRDDARNFAIYFPEDWSVRLPARGPRVEFESARLAVRVRVYVSESAGSLEEDVSRILADIRRRKMDVIRRGRIETHPVSGLRIASFDYRQSREGKTFRYRVSATVHRKLLYRVVLAAAESAFPGGLDAYDRMVGSLAFLR